MIPAVLLTSVDPVTSGKPMGGGRDAALLLLPLLDPGDVVSARIEAKLPDGSFKALVAGRALQLALPDYLAPGDTLELTFVGREPRLTFALKESLPQAPQAQLSVAGRLIAATMLPPGATAMPAAASAAAPLITTAPANGATVGVALARTLAQSGLFYESHQAEWVAGKRDLAQIMQEPQARLTQNRLRTEMGPAAATMDFSPAAPGPRSEQIIHPQAVPLVQQQLAALDTARVILQVEVWPGQWMQWEIDEREHEQGEPGAPREPDAPQSWNTQLRLDLPRLGTVSATLALDADGLRIRLATENSASAALLLEERASLQNALAAAGVPALGIAVAAHA